MTSPIDIDTAAAMTQPADPHTPAHDNPAAASGSETSGADVRSTAAATEPAGTQAPASIEEPTRTVPAGRTAAAQRPMVPRGVLVGVAGTMFAALVTVLGALMVAQLSAINTSITTLDTRFTNRIDHVETKLGDRIDRVETKLGDRIDKLDAEMRAGFAQINAILLDHTDRLARLETHAGLAAAAPSTDG